MEFAYAVYFPNISHPASHAALESMICTDHRQNKAQVTQRLHQLIPFITMQRAEEVYVLCCDFKHQAQAPRQQKLTNTGALSPTDQKRRDAVGLLRNAIREILIRVLRDRSFADVLADPQVLRHKYKVYDKRGNLV